MAYSLLFSYWSSDVCLSDLALVQLDDGRVVEASVAGVHEEGVEGGRLRAEGGRGAGMACRRLRQLQVLVHHGGGETGPVVAVGHRGLDNAGHRVVVQHGPAGARGLGADQIGRASWRERGCQYGEYLVVAGAIKKKKKKK